MANVSPDKLGAEVALDFFEQQSLLPLVDLLDRFEQHHFRLISAHADHGADILGETGAAVTDAGKNKMRPDAPVQD